MFSIATRRYYFTLLFLGKPLLAGRRLNIRAATGVLSTSLNTFNAAQYIVKACQGVINHVVRISQARI